MNVFDPQALAVARDADVHGSGIFEGIADRTDLLRDPLALGVLLTSQS